MEFKEAVHLYLSSLEQGESISFEKMRRIKNDYQEVAKKSPTHFWSMMDPQAKEDEDYVNFILRCHYDRFKDQKELAHQYVQKAKKKGEMPLAFYRLGVTYAKGICGIRSSNLAYYFFEKALIAGDEDAKTIGMIKTIIEEERKKKNYGRLSKLRHHLHLLYPDYSYEKAVEDILEDWDTVDADILYAISTNNNHAEVDIELQDKLMSQLYAPIIQDADLYRSIIDADHHHLEEDNGDIYNVVVNLYVHYSGLCIKRGLKEMGLTLLDSRTLLPYLKMSTLAKIRKQAFRGLLSVKDLDPAMDEFLKHLDDDTKLLEICTDDIKDNYLQFFLLSFVEINIEVNYRELERILLLAKYRNHDWQPLADHLNAFVDRLTRNGIEHHLPKFTLKNLPKIELFE